MSIPYARVGQALTRLAETDEQEAELRALVEKTKEQAKSMFTVIAASSSGTVLEREAAAYKHEDYKSAKAAEFNAIAQHQQVKNERAREVIVIDVWRSINSARNKGQIV